MPLINTSVTNMIQGVSQQPDSVRFAGQCDEQLNALSSVVDGLKKRPNTKHVVRMFESAISDKSFVHFIARDDEEKYVLVLDKATNKLFAFNTITGVQCTINEAAFADIPVGHYLNSASPDRDIKALTVADNTFLLNSTVEVKEETALTPPLEREAIVSINQGDYAKRYEIEIGRSNKPSIIKFWALFTDGRGGYIQSVQIVSSGYGIATWKYTGGQEQDLGLVPTFDSEGRIIAVAITDTRTWPMSVITGGTGRKDVTTYRAGVTPIDESFYSKMTAKTGTATQGGENADTNVIARNIVSLANHSGITQPTKLDQYDGTLTKTSSSKPAQNFDTTHVGHVIRFKWKSAISSQLEDFNIRTYDPLGGSGMTSAYKAVDSISALPLIAPDGFKVKVVGDVDIDQDDYYVEFSTKDGSSLGNGTWTETVGPNVPVGLDNSTMPMRFVNTGLNAFSLEEVATEVREAGDLDSNPPPSFVGTTINNMTFFKNRLGFLTDGSVIFSEAGKFFNFYRKTVSSLLDSAPIDVNVSSTRVTRLTAAVGFQENLLIFGDNVQFVMKGGELLTPQTVSVSPVTNFSFDTHDTPLVLGSYVYFPFSRGSYTGIREYTVNANTDTYDSAEITEHVPAYIPRELIATAGTTAENAYAVVSQNERNAIYFYKYFWENNTKALSSWSKFTFTGEIRGIEFIESTLYMVIVNNGQTSLVEMPLESGLSDDAGYVTHLDMRVAHKVQRRNFSFTGATGAALHLNNVNYGYDFEINGAVGYHSVPPSPEDSEILRGVDGKWYVYELGGATYAVSTADYAPYPWEADWTGTVLANATFSFNGARDTINLPYTPADNSVQVYTTDGLALNCTNSGSRVTLSNPLSTDTDVWAGIPYTMKYTFSEQLFKAQAGSGKSPSNASKMVIRNCSLYYDKSAHFKVNVTPKFRDTYTNIFTSDVVLGSPSLDSDFYRFPVNAPAQDTIITIENESALPSTFQSAEFESFVKPRSSRYG